MSIITLEFDNILKKSEIIMPLLSSSKNESGENYHDPNLTDKSQTAVFGIQTPLIMINSIVIDFDAIQYFNLKSEDRLPELILVVRDKLELINNIDKPGQDNEVRVQILPKFDNAYKKIDLTFFINDIQINGSLIRLTCSYKLPSLLSSQFKTFGKLDTYSLFKYIATETGLGFATNIAKLDDSRYMYCDNTSLYDIMNSEIEYSNATEHIMDWWVDLWDNVNLVDVKERYTTIDSNDDLKIWVAGQVNENTKDIEIVPQEVTAVINNYPGFSSSELFVKSYESYINSGTQMSKGTDKVFGIYEDINKEYLDYLIQDGDIKNDIYIKYNYAGENFGEYNYILAQHLRDSFIQKMNSESIKVTLQSPLLGLMRGHKVNFIRYVNDDIIENRIKNLEDNNIIDRNVECNIPLSEYEMTDDSANGQFRIDKTVSGQYLINGVDITYTNNSWNYKLTLIKPASTKTNILISDK